MVCKKCGCEQGVPAQFCRECGSALSTFPPPYPGPAMMWMPRMRVQQNLQPLGILWCVFGVYRILTSIVGAIAIRSLAHSGIFNDAPSFVPHLLGSMVPGILFISVLIGVANIITGYHLLMRQPWARTLALVMAVMSLIKPPFGTALGIYTLWVLAPQASGMEWQGMTPVRV